MSLRSVVVCVCGVTTLATGVAASTLAPVQLTGLKGATVSVFVDRELPGFTELERRATAAAVEALARDGNVTAEGPKGSYLRIEVSLHREANASTRSFVLLARVQWKESVRLLRAPSIGGKRGVDAITWTDQVVRIEDEDTSVAEVILKDVDWLVGSFASQARSVGQRH